MTGSVWLQEARAYPSGVVATPHYLASNAGAAMLADGGNAVDAAIAAAMALIVVEPTGNGLGSDAFAILWDGTALHGLNASGRAPAAWTPAYFRGKYGAQVQGLPLRGWDTVTVPGAVSAWMALSERFGKLPFADLLEPAIDLAERGYAVPVVVQQKWALAAEVEELVRQPGFAATFLPHGRAPQVGELFRMPGAARALRAIAATQGEAFYRGEIAQAICAHARQHGGSLVLSDLETFKPEWVRPISRDYRGYTVHEIPPNGQGIAALMALGMLSQFDLAALPIDGVESQHLQIEAMKLAFADTYRHVAEPSAMEVTAEQLLSDAYLAERARCIDPKRAQEFGPGTPPKGGTIYLSAADERGMMVSFIQSNYMGFGSGVVVPGFGLSLQNRGVCFSLDAASPNVVAPGKRPFHTIIPGMLTRRKAGSSSPGAAEEPPAAHEAVMAFGVMGGNMQPQGHLQTLVRMLDHAQNPQVACDAPRWRFDRGLDLSVEPEMNPATVQGLADRGHRIGTVADSYMDFGSGQFIWRLGDPGTQGYVGASDSRRDGLVAGF
ncbi:MAG TPA: gamma-glutamyltransferase family protein [Burkholderiaceae bacterium]|nr:gamma-glutamyltransferase family protein [Burkholderiaceae bacterium]